MRSSPGISKPINVMRLGDVPICSWQVRPARPPDSRGPRHRHHGAGDGDRLAGLLRSPAINVSLVACPVTRSLASVKPAIFQRNRA